jgi:antitoxin component YwqK of YwqJK toxin-antitoxin module
VKKEIDLGNGCSKSIYYYDSGEVSYEHYYLNDKRHREDGPARIGYYESGEVIYEDYFLNGKQVSKEEVELYRYEKQFDKEVEEALK